DGKMKSMTRLEVFFESVIHGSLKGDRNSTNAMIKLLVENGYFDKNPLAGTYGVLRVERPMTDEVAWSLLAQEEHKIAEEVDRNQGKPDAPESKPKRPRVKLIKTKS
ncbi:MAG: hypothetical protein Q8M07_08545, partial [Prosthecobacter sp.]|nr:hypothetical protein [Prosthecobacter sp.]